MGKAVGFDLNRARQLANAIERANPTLTGLHTHVHNLLAGAAHRMHPQGLSSDAGRQQLLTGSSAMPGISTPPPLGGRLTPPSANLPGALSRPLHNLAADLWRRLERLELLENSSPTHVKLHADQILADPPVAAGPPAPDSPRAKTWWKGLTRGQQTQYEYLRPAALHGMPGLPDDVRAYIDDKYFRGGPYPTSSKDTAGNIDLSATVADVLTIKLDHGLSLREQRMSDGTVRVTILDEDGLSVSFGDEGETKNKRASGAVSIATGGKLSSGDTWTFRNQDQVNRFRSEINRLLYLYGEKHGPEPAPDVPHPIIPGALTTDSQIEKICRRIGQPSSHIAELSTDLTLKGEFTLPGGIGAKFTGTGTVSHDYSNPKNPTTTTSYNFTAEGNLGKDARPGAATTYGVLRSGTVQITRDVHDRIIKVQIVGQTRVDAGTQLNIGDPDKTGGAFSSRAQAYGNHTVTVSLPVTTAQQRQAADQWWKSRGSSLTTAATGADLDPSRPPTAGADEFTKQLHQHAQVMVFDHKGTESDVTVSAKYKRKVFDIGGEFSIGDTNDRVTRARYLGAPDKHGQRHYRDLPAR